MKPKDQLIKELKKEIDKESEDFTTNWRKYNPSKMTYDTLTVRDAKLLGEFLAYIQKRAISTIKEFLKGYKLVKKTEWIEQFMKAHKLKTYQEAIDALCCCYRAWNSQIDLASEYKLVKVEDLLDKEELKILEAHLMEGAEEYIPSILRKLKKNIKEKGKVKEEGE